MEGVVLEACDAADPERVRLRDTSYEGEELVEAFASAGGGEKGSSEQWHKIQVGGKDDGGDAGAGRVVKGQVEATRWAAAAGKRVGGSLGGDGFVRAPWIVRWALRVSMEREAARARAATADCREGDMASGRGCMRRSAQISVGG